MTPDADRPWARRLLALITRTWFLVIAAVVVVLAVAYTLAGFFLVPRLIISYVPRYVQEQLKRRAEDGGAPGDQGRAPQHRDRGGAPWSLRDLGDVEGGRRRGLGGRGIPCPARMDWSPGASRLPSARRLGFRPGGDCGSRARRSGRCGR